MSSKYLVIIPTYNEKNNIQEIIPQVLSISDKNKRALDILVVDDNSPDKTYLEVEKIHKKDGRVNLLLREKKEGLGKAYEAGFKWAQNQKYDYIISMDADLSHQPKYLQDMIDGDKKIDLLVGSRYIRGGGVVGWDWKRQFNSRGANIVTRLMLGLKTHDVTAGFKRYSRVFLDALLRHGIKSGGYALMVETVFFAKEKKYQIAEFPIVFVDRRAGQSKISGELKKSVKIVWQLFIRRKSIRQFIKFSIVGFSNFLLDSGIYILETRIFKIAEILAKTVSFIASATSSYYFNRKWTFKDTNKNITKQYLKFILVATTGLEINVAVFYISHNIFEIYDLISLVIAAAITMVWNFIANKWWTFK